MANPALTAHLVADGNAVVFQFGKEYHKVFKMLPWDAILINQIISNQTIQEGPLMTHKDTHEVIFEGVLSTTTIDQMAFGLDEIQDYASTASDIVEFLLAEIK